ncbi:MAG: DUF1499 domain-containing protein [Pseudomonadota bacterium]
MIIRLIAVGTLAAAVGFAAWVRLAPFDTATWHADPEAGTRTGNPNDALMGPGGDREAIAFPESPDALLARLDQIALAEPRTTRLAGDPADAHVTYVQRSALMGYPDVISVKALPSGGGSTLVMWSRARFGLSDLGVNAKRVSRWVAALSDG